FDAWLVLRGVKTLAVRMRQHCENARAVAALLEQHDAVERVYYPGLPTHPGHEIAARQMRDFGGMVSFLAASEEDAHTLVARTKIWKLAESLGGVESLTEVPARMTHASTADAPFAAPRHRVHVSEVGAPHVIDPTRLINSARRLYGDELDTLYGEPLPVPEENVEPIWDTAAGVKSFAAPGHASHHACYLLDDGTLLAGDAT